MSKPLNLSLRRRQQRERARRLATEAIAAVRAGDAAAERRIVAAYIGRVRITHTWRDSDDRWRKHLIQVAADLAAAREEADKLRRALEWLAAKIADYGSCPLDSEWKDAEGYDVCFAGPEGEDCPSPDEVWRCYAKAALAAAQEGEGA